MIETPIINLELCDGCGICIDVCPAGALALRNNKIVFTATEDCSYCGECEAACPKEAISCPYEIVMEPQKGELRQTFWNNSQSSSLKN